MLTSLSTLGGLLKKILKQGDGEKPPTDGNVEVEVHYTGWLIGKKKKRKKK
jgi:FKBP-type peptidyl-prolyl cis-trans isomerase